jgi:hypothetical protein
MVKPLRAIDSSYDTNESDDHTLTWPCLLRPLHAHTQFIHHFHTCLAAIITFQICISDSGLLSAGHAWLVC